MSDYLVEDIKTARKKPFSEIIRSSLIQNLPFGRKCQMVVFGNARGDTIEKFFLKKGNGNIVHERDSFDKFTVELNDDLNNRIENAISAARQEGKEEGEKAVRDEFDRQRDPVRESTERFQRVLLLIAFVGLLAYLAWELSSAGVWQKGFDALKYPGTILFIVAFLSLIVFLLGPKVLSDAIKAFRKLFSGA